MITERQARFTSTSPQRLDTARERIAAVCAEYNYFNPTRHTTNLGSNATSCAGQGNGRCFCLPDPTQLKTDLQVLFERFLALESDAADNTYRRISLNAWEMASDEYGAFNWEELREIIDNELESPKEHGSHVVVSDLVTLRIVPICF
jgi:hypothetical protein